MAKPNGMTLQEALKPEIVELLSHQQLSLKELETRIGRNYYTVRGALNLLIDEGVARPVGYGGRGCKYMLQNEDGPNRIIPRIRLGKDSFKLTDLLASRHQDVPAAAKAVINLPRHITRLFKVGEALAVGTASAALPLESIRIQMSEDRAALARALEIYDQVLSNPRVWEPEVLTKWPNDIEYNAAEVQASYDFYFKTD